MIIYNTGILFKPTDLVRENGVPQHHNIPVIKAIIEHPFTNLTWSTMYETNVHDISKVPLSEAFDIGLLPGLDRSTMITKYIIEALEEGEECFVTTAGGFSRGSWIAFNKNPEENIEVFEWDMSESWYESNNFSKTLVILSELIAIKDKRGIGVEIDYFDWGSQKTIFLPCHFGNHYATLVEWAENKNVKLTDEFINENVRFINKYSKIKAHYS